jgi:hypothetical protein
MPAAALRMAVSLIAPCSVESAVKLNGGPDAVLLTGRTALRAVYEFADAREARASVQTMARRKLQSVKISGSTTANPLDDIRNTRRIAAVYLRGMRLDREALLARWKVKS